MMGYRNYFKLPILIMMTLSLCHCGPHWMDDAGLRDETLYPPTLPIDNPRPPQTSGAIFQDGYEMSLYRDQVPARKGDILTVRLEESTKGEKKAHLKANKTNQHQLQVSGMGLGYLTNANAQTQTATQFDGNGTSDQENKLNGNISVTVVNVLSNGNLMIQGESWLTINQGREYVRLSGIVRPNDIDATNSVSSQRIANARITYSGNGQVGSTSNSGLVTQFILKFFPF